MCQLFRDLRRNQWQQWSEEGCQKPMPGVWAPACGACQKDANRVFFHGALHPQKLYGLWWTREERDRECEPRPTSLFTLLPSSYQPWNAKVTTHSFVSADTKLLYTLHFKVLIHSFVSADTKLLYALHFKVLMHYFVSVDTKLLYALHSKVTTLFRLCRHQTALRAAFQGIDALFRLCRHQTALRPAFQGDATLFRLHRHQTTLCPDAAWLSGQADRQA